MLTKAEFQALLNQGPVLLDGATASNLQKAGMPRGCCTEAWVLENPEKLLNLQRQYFEAGSQIIYAPTFQAQPIALKAVGLEDRTRFFPNQLSGGQCQRVAIARAIVSKPALLLADEPTGALDSTAGQQIMDIFRQLSQEGMTIIMITHEREIAACADKICYIFDGQLSDTDQRKKGGQSHEV